MGWYDKNSHGQTHQVGLKLPNELGLYDMSGNVWEWCEDLWSETYDNQLDNNDSTEEDNVQMRVTRGGSIEDRIEAAVPSSRFRLIGKVGVSNVGFRLVSS